MGSISRRPHRAAFRWLLPLAALALASCSSMGVDATGAISVSLNAPAASKSVSAPVSLDIATYDLSGTGPGGAAFNVTILASNASSYIKAGLNPGEWQVVAKGRNAEGDIVAVGSGTASVVAEQTSSLLIDCTLEPGTGSLKLDISWPAEAVTDASVTGWILPEGGTSQAITFSMGQAGTATATIPSLAEGSYRVGIGLRGKRMNQDNLLWSTVETAVLLKERQTSGTWTLDESDLDTAGSIDIGITSDTQKPIELSFTGIPALPIDLGDDLTVSASGSPAPDQWQWYLDGQALSGETADSITIGASLDAGLHFLSVVAAKDTRLGSGSFSFRINTTAAP